MTKDTPPLQLDAATEAELDRVLESCIAVDLRDITLGNEATMYIKDLRAALTRLLLLQRQEELQDIREMFGGEVSSRCFDHLVKRLAELQAQLEKEGQSE